METLLIRFQFKDFSPLSPWVRDAFLPVGGSRVCGKQEHNASPIHKLECGRKLLGFASESSALIFSNVKQS